MTKEKDVSLDQPVLRTKFVDDINYGGPPKEMVEAVAEDIRSTRLCGFSAQLKKVNATCEESQASQLKKELEIHSMQQIPVTDCIEYLGLKVRYQGSELCMDCSRKGRIEAAIVALEEQPTK